MPFIRPALQDLIDRAIADIESRLPGTDARLLRSNLNVLARVHSGAAHSLYGYLDWIAKQILPDTAEAETLERIASIWGLSRKVAGQATGSITFTGTDASVIPISTTVQRSDGVEFTTDAEGTIASGTASVAITAVEGGTNSNTAAASSVSLSSPISGVNSQATVDAGGIANGIDTETDDALRARLLERIQEPPHGGASFDYIAWAKEISGVTRAWVYPLEGGDGTVAVRFVVDDHETSLIPDAAKVTEVNDHIQLQRPVTAVVTVAAPVAVPLNFSIDITPSDQTIKDAVQAELEDMLLRDAEPGGAILLSRIREAVSLAAGETDNDVTVPAADVAHATGDMATMGVITWA
ncbi:MAG: baseplate J protein [Gammaproteobacteria bacterium]|nr:baseplate J protein [Gammaproteobacteria bacterium]